ncbi:MAG: hypothetical protein A2038_06510 [Deltaproteobacteria bacterium GWA2_57_13]|nr:MAG: hypothetical protein A2038_06510 [Deltaproteobacteria bacterium GWA2_57_13]
MGEPLRVLIVEDSEDDTLLLVRELQRGGYDPTFERVDSAEAMARALAARSWQIVLADYTMPQFKGTDALELLKETRLDIPLIFVSGATGEDLAVAAMKTGAHDYVIKGNLKRLTPAIARELREAEIRRQRKRDGESLRRQEKRMWVLYEINQAITCILDLRDLVNILIQNINLFLPYSASTVSLLNQETRELESVPGISLRETQWRSHILKRALAWENLVLEAKSPVAVRNIQKDLRAEEAEFFRNHGLVAYLGAPLLAQHEILGVLGYYADEEREFEEEEVRFLTTLAGQAGIAIRNSQLYEKTKSQVVESEKAKQVKDEFLVVLARELSAALETATTSAGSIRETMLQGPGEKAALEQVAGHSTELVTRIQSLLAATKAEAKLT